MRRLVGIDAGVLHDHGRAVRAVAPRAPRARSGQVAREGAARPGTGSRSRRRRPRPAARRARPPAPRASRAAISRGLLRRLRARSKGAVSARSPSSSTRRVLEGDRLERRVERAAGGGTDRFAQSGLQVEDHRLVGETLDKPKDYRSAARSTPGREASIITFYDGCVRAGRPDRACACRHGRGPPPPTYPHAEWDDALRPRGPAPAGSPVPVTAKARSPPHELAPRGRPPTARRRPGGSRPLRGSHPRIPRDAPLRPRDADAQAPSGLLLRELGRDEEANQAFAAAMQLRSASRSADPRAASPEWTTEPVRAGVRREGL